MRQIDADALNIAKEVETACKAMGFAEKSRFEGFVTGWLMGAIAEAPTIDAVPVVRGEWIDSPTGDYAICSHCHVEWNVFDNDTYRFRHCPACGAKMESEGGA